MRCRQFRGIVKESRVFSPVTVAKHALTRLSPAAAAAAPLALLGFLIACGGAAHGQQRPTHSPPGDQSHAPSPPTAVVAERTPRVQCKRVQARPAHSFSCDKPRVQDHAIVTTGDDKLQLRLARFADLPGWRDDQHADALVAFLASCVKLSAMDRDARVGTGPFGGKARQWLRACHAAKKVPVGEHKKAKQFFEKEFRAYATFGSKGSQGKITGYYVQPLRASRTRKGRYQFPLYRRPADLVAVSLSEFIDDGRSRRIWGQINARSTKLEPYPERLEYRQARSQDDSHVLLWIDDPADAIAVEIEGSGRAQLDDGSVVMIGFAGKNGRKSGKLGSIAKAMRELSNAHKAGPWSPAELARYQEIADEKTSIVFFETDARTGAIGSQNVVLTPQRSLAVDRAVISLSTPVWVDTRAPRSPKGRIAPYRHLLIAQDTGGAIVGTMRGDIYWGQDRAAVAMGKRVNNPGRMWLLLPRALKVRTSPK